jgi:phosphatidylinositol alpha-1,6-mannosyltransferase
MTLLESLARPGQAAPTRGRDKVPSLTPGHSLDVLLLADRTPPAIGGRESVLREVLLRQPPERTRLVAPRTGGALGFDRACAVPIHRVPAWPWLGAAANGWVRRTHFRWVTKQKPPGMVVAFGLGQDGARALEMHRASGTPYVLHLEAPELHAARKQIAAGGERARTLQEVLDEAEAILVASRACRLEAYKAGVLPHRIEVLAPGVDLERFAPGPKPEHLVRRLEVGRGPVLLTVSGRGPAKDPVTLFQAFAGVKGQKAGATLLVVGPVDSSWRSRANAAGVLGAVRFAGVVGAKELPEYYRAADVFLAAHREDRAAGVVAGVEVALVEALASGLPIAGTVVPAVDALAPSEEVGLLVEPGAHGRLAAAALELVGSGDSSLREAARERAVATHSAVSTAARFREFLEVVYFRRLGRGRLTSHEEGPAAERPAA